jgi:hypothetical protein
MQHRFRTVGGYDILQEAEVAKENISSRSQHGAKFLRKYEEMKAAGCAVHSLNAPPRGTAYAFRQCPTGIHTAGSRAQLENEGKI